MKHIRMIAGVLSVSLLLTAAALPAMAEEDYSAAVTASMSAGNQRGGQRGPQGQMPGNDQNSPQGRMPGGNGNGAQGQMPGNDQNGSQGQTPGSQKGQQGQMPGGKGNGPQGRMPGNDQNSPQGRMPGGQNSQQGQTPGSNDNDPQGQLPDVNQNGQQDELPQDGQNSQNSDTNTQIGNQTQQPKMDRRNGKNRGDGKRNNLPNEKPDNLPGTSLSLKELVEKGVIDQETMEKIEKYMEENAPALPDAQSGATPADGTTPPEKPDENQAAADGTTPPEKPDVSQVPADGSTPPALPDGTQAPEDAGMMEQDDLLARLVEAGILTQEQADAIQALTPAAPAETASGTAATENT